MLTEENLDEPVMPDDIVATDQEIVDAVVHARSDSATNIRLLAAARVILARSKQLKRTCQPEDLLQDAVEAVLAGRRKWKTNRVDFKGLLAGIMRSLASSRDNSITAKSPGEMMEHELHLVGEEQDSQNLEEVYADTQTTEEIVLRKEQETIEENQMDILCTQFEPGSMHSRILEKIREGFSGHAEIYEALGIEESVYRNAWKAIMRAATRLSESAKEQYQ